MPEGRPYESEHSTVQTDAALVAGDRQWLRTGYDLYIIEPDRERRVPLCYAHMTLGSSTGEKKNDIVLDYPGISNRQAILKLLQDNVYFSNLDTRMKTTINGEETTFRQVKDGDEIQMGPVKIRLIQLTEAVAFLEGYTDPHRREHWTLGPGRTSIGRQGKRQNQVVLNDATVSREHCTIEYTDGVFVLRPESSATWVNAEPVEGMRILQDEDLIQVGQQLLRFRTYRSAPKPRALSNQAATIVFSDIWDYTRMAEDRPLEQTIAQMNEMYKKLGKVVMSHQGHLMSYLGDAMMAMFENEDHAKRAVAAALEMVERLEELNGRWENEGAPRLRAGVGICTGEVMVGDVGATGHREFAAMGDTTNLAARIEKLTREFDCHVLASGTTVAKLESDFQVRPLGTIEIRGRRNPVEVYEVLGRTR